MSITLKPRRWCVYHHLSDGKVFYVGTGCATRPFATANRNQRWEDIVFALDSFEVEIVGWYDKSWEAMTAERLAIRELKPAANIVGVSESKRTKPKNPYSDRVCILAAKPVKIGRRKTESQMVSELAAKVQGWGGLKRTAAHLGVSSQFLCDIIAGRKGITDRLAQALGYRRVVEFEKL